MKEEGRQILHLDLDTFFVSVERLRDRRLLGRPVLVGGSSDRAVVSAASYEARQYGVHSAMPMRMARQLCPEAIVVRGDMDTYSRYSTMVTSILSESAPVVEKASIDEHYLDLTGMERFFGCLRFSQELRTKIMKETGLPVSLGLSDNKTVAKVATGVAKPNGEKHVPRQQIIPFLDPLPIGKIPMLGPQSERRLRHMGVDTIYHLRQISPELLRRVLGENGVQIWNKAHGIDLSPVQPYREQVSLSTETTFEADSTDAQAMADVLGRMVYDLSFRLRKMKKLSACVAVKVRYADFETHTRQRRIPFTALDLTLRRHVRELFFQAYQRRQRVRLVGIRFSHLIPGTEQLDLFSVSAEQYSLCQALDKIRVKYGSETVLPARYLHDEH